MHKIKIPSSQIIMGVYVSELDRPWVDTPFPFQGFKVSKEKEIRMLRDLCEYVFIDTDKGVVPPESGPSGTPELPKDVPPAPIPRPEVEYTTEVDMEDEISVATEIHTALSTEIQHFMDQVRANNKIDLAAISNIVGQMRDSMIRNPNAFVYLSRLKAKDLIAYNHCMQCSAYALAFGRQLGLPSDQLHELAMGALLLDVGKLKLPSKLLNKNSSLTLAEFEVVKQHVRFSLAVVENSPNVSARAIKMIETHHERFDGSGYAGGLKGGQIPLFGRIAGIVDFFTAVTNERVFAPSMSPHDAMMHLYEQRNTLFQSELIEYFIQTMGAFPIGTLIELSTGEVGIVIAQNEVRRLQPRVLVVLDEDKKNIGISPIYDLMQETSTKDGVPLKIVRSLPPGEYGIDPAEYYL